MEAITSLLEMLDDHGPRFLETRRQFEDGAVCLMGVPYDGTTSFRPGTRFGPSAIRTASVGLETYSPEQDRDYTNRTVVDLGDLEVSHGAATPVMSQVRQAVRLLLEAGGVPLILGGEHSITAAAVEAFAERFEDLVVVQFDAHADLRDGYLGESYSHAAAMRRSLASLKDGSLLQVGIRSGTREEFAEMRTSKRLITPNPDALAAALASFGSRPIYLTVDLDVFDPSSLPGTGTPEPGGIDWHTFAALLRSLPAGRIVGADVMELAPQLDPTGVSSVLAAKVAREIILRLGERAAQ